MRQKRRRKTASQGCVGWAIIIVLLIAFLLSLAAAGALSAAMGGAA